MHAALVCGVLRVSHGSKLTQTCTPAGSHKRIIAGRDFEESCKGDDGIDYDDDDDDEDQDEDGDDGDEDGDDEDEDKDKDEDGDDADAGDEDDVDDDDGGGDDDGDDDGDGDCEEEEFVAVVVDFVIAAVAFRHECPCLMLHCMPVQHYPRGMT